MTDASLVKIRMICDGNKNATSVIRTPTSTANRTPIDAIFRILPVSRFPQYWAARIRIAPSMPATNICSTVCSWFPTYTPEIALSPSVPTIRLSAKFTAKVTAFCSAIGMASRTSVL